MTGFRTKIMRKEREGNEAPVGANVLEPRQRARRRSLRRTASRRSTTALAKARTLQLSPGPRFLELTGANGRTPRRQCSEHLAGPFQDRL